MPLAWDEVAACDPAAFTLRTAPGRLAEQGDAAAGMDGAAGSLDALLELSRKQEADGHGDAPWPPHYRKQPGEPVRAAPSKRRSTDGRLLTVAKAQLKEDALAGLERWKRRHPRAASHLTVEDVLVDVMRGRSSTWTRIRVDLRHIPEDARPPEEKPDPDYDPWGGAPKTRASS
jgi:hypothetical protein